MNDSPLRPRRYWLAIVLACAATGVPVASLVLRQRVEVREQGCMDTWSDRSEAVYSWLAGSATLLSSAFAFLGIVLVLRRWWRFPLALAGAICVFLVVGFMMFAQAYELEGCL